MNVSIMDLATLSSKVALLGGVVYLQLFLLRRAPAASRSRLCSLALIAVLLLAAGEALTPNWLVKAPVFHFAAVSAQTASAAAKKASISSWLMVIWLAGATLMLVRAITGRIALTLVRRRSERVDSQANVDVRIANVQTPILCGLFRPTVLLPATASTWTEEQQRMVMAHELTHFRQGDCWTNLLAQFVRAALWFHPVSWWIASRLSREQELTCDEAVIASGHSSHDYAAFLLASVRDLRSREMFVCAMAGSGKQSLKRRFANLLDARPRPQLRGRIAASLTAFVLIALTLTTVRPVWSQSAKGDGKVYKMSDGIQPPKVLNKVDPKYTPEAKDAKIEGAVLLSTVVTAEGKADNIVVVRSLDAGLDQNAIDAVQQWTFQPGTKDGAPVAVKATIEVNFRLQ